MRGLVWFKKDLRLHDNPALYQASLACKDGLLGLYIVDHSMWREHHTSSLQIEFILSTLNELNDHLAKLNISLLVITTDKSASIPNQILELMRKYKLTKLFFNREYEINESRRDTTVTALLDKNQFKHEAYNDQLIIPHELVKTNQGECFKVFTAFKNQWKKTFDLHSIKTVPKPKKQIILDIDLPLYKSYRGSVSSIWTPGEVEAQRRLKRFIRHNLMSYDKQRDYPALDKTSRLSPYLALGMISARECFLTALSANNGELFTGNQGTLTWINELIWRDFYKHILISVPRVCMGKAYILKTECLPWSYDKNLLSAWQQGQTGFPIVDAAMRQLNQTGWMHNRLRMIVAMFLSKNLFLDWRLGERYFTEKLIDADFALNNGGWQWSASTGTDAVPYFRIFNPMTQSERFDAKGVFIRQFCPELKTRNNREIHYPINPIIDYKKSRDSTILAFKNLT